MIAPTRPRCYVGIDPGKHGAVAWLVGGEAAGEHVDTSDAHALADVLRALCLDWDPAVGVEVPTGRPQGQGGVSQMFRQGRTIGICEGVVCALQLPLHTFTPVQWWNIAKPGKRPKEAKPRKELSRTIARRKWPHVDLARVKDGAIADALHIAEALRRQEVGV